MSGHGSAQMFGLGDDPRQARPGLVDRVDVEYPDPVADHLAAAPGGRERERRMVGRRRRRPRRQRRLDRERAVRGEAGGASGPSARGEDAAAHVRRSGDRYGRPGASYAERHLFHLHPGALVFEHETDDKDERAERGDTARGRHDERGPDDQKHAEPLQ